MADPKMVSMKRTAADKREAKKMNQAPCEAAYPDYPWGLCLHLESDELEKLGLLKALPDVGTEMTLEVKVKVTRCSQSAAEGADDQTSVDLQVTDIGIEDEAAE